MTNNSEEVWPAFAADSGKIVMPRPEATIYFKVSKELPSAAVRIFPCGSSMEGFKLGQASNTWSRKQCPVPNSNTL